MFRERYGPWGRAYDLFRRWQRDGIWPRIFTELQARADAQDLITWDLNVDSTIVRAHQHAAGQGKGGLQKEPPGGIVIEPDDHGLGRSRGGLTTKLHLSAEQGQKPMSIVVTVGQRGGSPQFEPVLDKVRVPAAPSLTSSTRPATERSSAPAAAVHRSSTRRTTRPGTPSSAASTG